MTQFLRRHAARIVIGSVLVAVAYWAISVYATHQREQRIAQTIEADRWGEVDFVFCGPSQIPPSIQARLPLRRINWVSMQLIRRHWSMYERPKEVSAELLAEIGTLSRLEGLALGGRGLQDASLERLGQLRNLKRLYLTRTSVTDVGLESLKGLLLLKTFDLHYTETTPEGRAMLRTALPDCTIMPNP